MSISRRLRFEVFKRDSFTCQYCGAKSPDIALEVDHVHPRSLGGRDDMENLKAACVNCNRGKAGVPIPRIWTFTDGEPGILGPRHGETVQRTEFFPAYWVFQGAEGFEFYEDELDVDVYFTVYEQRLKWGHPMRQGLQGREEVSNRWFDGYAGHRALAGFYLPRSVDVPHLSLLAWYTPADAIAWVLTINTHPEPEDVA